MRRDSVAKPALGTDTTHGRIPHLKVGNELRRSGCARTSRGIAGLGASEADGWRLPSPSPAHERNRPLPARLAWRTAGAGFVRFADRVS